MRYEITGGAQAALFAIDGTTLKTATTLAVTLINIAWSRDPRNAADYLSGLVAMATAKKHLKLPNEALDVIKAAEQVSLSADEEKIQWVKKHRKQLKKLKKSIL